MVDSQELAGTVVFPEYVRDRLADVYQHLMVGVGITGAAGVLAFRSGLAHKLIALSPMALGIGSIVVLIGSNMVTQSISYEHNRTGKYLAWSAFCGLMGVSLSTLGFVGGPILFKAAVATGMMVGSLSLVAANSPSNEFLHLGGPLAIGLGVVVAASFGQMFFPASALLHNVALYGGLGLFGAYVLYDTSRVLTIAERTPQGQFDPVNAGMSLYMDIINIFVRLVQVFAGSNSKKRR
jgi:FtsH-binding integral membrane protein